MLLFYLLQKSFVSARQCAVLFLHILSCVSVYAAPTLQKRGVLFVAYATVADLWMHSAFQNWIQSVVQIGGTQHFVRHWRVLTSGHFPGEWNENVINSQGPDWVGLWEVTHSDWGRKRYESVMWCRNKWGQEWFPRLRSPRHVKCNVYVPKCLSVQRSYRTWPRWPCRVSDSSIILLSD